MEASGLSIQTAFTDRNRKFLPRKATHGPSGSSGKLPSLKVPFLCSKCQPTGPTPGVRGSRVGSQERFSLYHTWKPTVFRNSAASLSRNCQVHFPFSENKLLFCNGYFFKTTIRAWGQPIHLMLCSMDVRAK